ncbi:MAG: cohesin domain-containing protein, partial [Candidatus Neomarinimicrobiota bacterium]
IFAWRHSNELMWPDTAYDYSSRILYSFRFGYSAWTDWMSGEMLPDYNIPNQKYNSATGIHTLELHSLEDGQHRFEVRSKYPSDVEEDKWPVRLFSVDALDGTALIVSPGYVYLDSGSSFIISVKAVDVTDLLGFRLVLKYDPGMLTLDEYSIKTEVSDLLGLSSGEILEFISTDGQNGIFDVNIAVAGGTVTGITDSGILARIRFAHTGRTGSTEIKIAPESTLRDVYNNDILNVRQGGQVIVW